MCRVIASGEAAVRGEFGLYAVKDFCTDQRGNLRHKRPFLAWGVDAGIGRMFTGNRSGTALQRAPSVLAVAVDLAMISRVG